MLLLENAGTQKRNGRRGDTDLYKLCNRMEETGHENLLRLRENTRFNTRGHANDNKLRMIMPIKKNCFPKRIIYRGLEQAEPR